MECNKQIQFNNNVSKEFVELIENEFGLDKRILEISCGPIPFLSKQIAKKQIRIGKGTITAIDPLLVMRKYKNITLIKQQITSLTDISNYDLIVSKEPCMATELIIKLCYRYSKEFSIIPCDCYNLLPEFMDFSDQPIKQWYDYVFDVCKTWNKSDKFEVSKTYFNEECNYKNPIYIRKKK